jgi:radical SAM protein with 4Fe4S-binding SPASM domain
MKPTSIVARLAAGVMDLMHGDFPRTVRIETTNHCNAACSFCPRSTIGRSKGFMEQSLYEKVLQECVAGGARSLHMHNFGEPLMDKQLPDRIKQAKDAGIPNVKLFCNGHYLKGDMAERLLASGLDEIKVSIDGADAEEFNRIRVGLNHANVVENTKNFRILRDAKHGQKAPHIIAACTETSDKKKTQEMLVGVVDRIDYARLHNWAGAKNWLRNWKIRKPCDRVWRTLTILINGDVALCCLDYSGKEVLGNVREQTIAEIWNNPRYREVRDAHRKSEQEKLSLCKDCTKSYV